MNILVVGDSLSFPRGHKSQRVGETWPPLLQRGLSAYVWNRSQPASTSKTVLENLQQLNFYCAYPTSKLDAIIIQVGIVDATPRDFNLLIHRAILRLPKGKSAVRTAFRALSKTLHWKRRPWISTKEFKLNLSKIIRLCAEIAHAVIFVSIAPPRHHLLSNEPDLPELVKTYNQTMQASVLAFGENFAMFIDPWQTVSDLQMDSLLLADGHHLSYEGHLHLAQSLGEFISQPSIHKYSGLPVHD